MKRILVVTALIICLLITFAAPTIAEAPTYLFITSGVDTTIDESLIARIKSLGFEVEVITHDNLDATAAAEAAKGKGLFIFRIGFLR